MIHTITIPTRTSDQYSVSASGMVGDNFIDLTIKWPRNIENEYNNVMRNLKVNASDDPIVRTDGTYDRTYDYVSYYSGITDVEAWLAEQTELPVSVSASSAKVALVTARVNATQAIQKVLNDYEDMMVWWATVYIDDEKVVIPLQLGDWVETESGYKLRFESDDRAKIGFNDLEHAELDFYVAD